MLYAGVREGSCIFFKVLWLSGESKMLITSGSWVRIPPGPLSDGVVVAQRILVLSAEVRILLG